MSDQRDEEIKHKASDCMLPFLECGEYFKCECGRVWAPDRIGRYRIVKDAK